MDETSSSSNIEWKKNKKGFGATEKVTRKTNVKKALEFEAKEKKPLALSKSVKPSDLPKGIKKLRKKIKEAYEEDDESEYSDVIPLNLDSSLYNALYEDEKRQINQQNILKNQSMQQTAGKMEAVMQADRMVKETGFSGINKKLANTAAQDALLPNNTLETVLSKEAATKIKTDGKILSAKETVTMLRGIDRIRKMAEAAETSQTKSLEKMKLDEVLNAGEKSTDDKQIAELILKKSGRKKKTDIEKIVLKNKQNEAARKKQKKTQEKPKKQTRMNLSAKDIHRN
ncbi:MAG: hypothetical protein IJV97_04195 [Alphaproteobacteria bacterium]|nr:hypothetical protein [Alphaproteobacteria bacterium]